jgi:hypothetical protein
MPPSTPRRFRISNARSMETNVLPHAVPTIVLAKPHAVSTIFAEPRTLPKRPTPLQPAPLHRRLHLLLAALIRLPALPVRAARAPLALALALAGQAPPARRPPELPHRKAVVPRAGLYLPWTSAAATASLWCWLVSLVLSLCSCKSTRCAWLCPGL